MGVRAVRIQVRGNRELAAQLGRLRRLLDRDLKHKVYRRVAYRGMRMLMRLTPRRWTGNTRKAWGVKETYRGYQIYNPAKAMWWLEYGTKAHGPKHKKLLFIPLNRKAALSGWTPSLKRGKDYRLTKRVRGIKPRLIVTKARKDVERDMLRELQRELDKILPGL